MKQIPLEFPEYKSEYGFTGEKLRDVGIRLSEESANNKVEGWSEKCYELLKEYLKINPELFMTEFFRAFVESSARLEPPPSARSYGAVISRARKEGLIKHCGYAPTSNYKAHKTPASVWQRCS